MLLLAVALVACRAPIGVKKKSYESVYQELTVNAVEGRSPSSTTFQILHLLDLEEEFQDEPDEVLSILHERAREESRRAFLFAVSELSYLAAKRSGRRDQYLAAAVYAYLFLFSEEDPVPPNPFDARFRLACDIYNRGLARALLDEDGEQVVLDEPFRDLPVGRIAMRVDWSGFPWEPKKFERFLPADAFDVRGLAFRNRLPGLGVPLIAVPGEEDSQQLGDFVFRRIELPATAFLRLEGGIAELSDGELSATLELYFTYDAPEVQVAGQVVPLEADLTAPLAHSLEESDIWDFALKGFFSGEFDAWEDGMYMPVPYQAGKIPVVFVHGTASQPARWAAMFNALRIDRVLRSRYQFWFYMYHTGNPVLYSAEGLRSSLGDLIQNLDPQGADPALNQMIVVGHSQGGLLTKLTVTKGDDRLWSALTDKDFDELDLVEDEHELLRRCFFFDPVPQVQRVIFISTPHRGSFVAGSWIGRFFGGMVSGSRRASSITKSLALQGVLPEELEDVSSVDDMAPDEMFVPMMAELAIAPAVRVHSIVAVEGRGAPEKGDDGVVSYQSAHLEDADSEFIVRASHSCQNHPLAIGEVRRILLEHVASLEPVSSDAED